MGGSGSRRLPTFKPEDLTVKKALGRGTFGTLAAGKTEILVVAKPLSQPLHPKSFAPVRHDNVCRIIGILEKPGPEILVLWEYCKGGSIHDRLEKNGCRDETRMSYALQASSGLKAIHQARALHTNLNPRNILLSSNDQIKISDYNPRLLLKGQADLKLVETHDNKTSDKSKICYMAPEVVVNGRASDKSDVYSLGMCLKYIWFRDAREGMRNPEAKRKGADFRLALLGRTSSPEPTERPDIDEIVTILAKAASPSGSVATREQASSPVVLEGEPEGADSESTQPYLQGLAAWSVLVDRPKGEVPDALPEWYLRQQAEMPDGLGVPLDDEGEPP